MYNIFHQIVRWSALTLLLVGGCSTAMAQKEAPAIQLRSNGIYDLAASPNIGLEIQTDLGIAWQFDYIGAWWNRPKDNHFFSNYAFQSELRYYFCRNLGFPYDGHHAGVYGQMATYDFEFGKKGVQCNSLEKSFGLGMSYGYELPISSHFAIDFTIGVGFFSSKYNKYNPKDNNDGYVRTESHKLSFWGPTKLEISLVWNLNYISINNFR